MTRIFADTPCLIRENPRPSASSVFYIFSHDYNWYMVTWLNIRGVRIAWGLFTLLALSLAVPGITLYRQALVTVCESADCLPGQVSVTDVSIARATGYEPTVYADNVLVFYFLAFVYCLLIAALFIWRKPAHGAAVAGAFALTATATTALTAATVAAHPALRPAAQLINFVGLSASLPFLAALPDGRFDPRWLRWVAIAAVPVAALVAFTVIGPPVSYWLGMAIVVLIVGVTLYRYRTRRGTAEVEGAAWALAGVLMILAAQWASRPLALLPLPPLSFSAIPTGYFPFYLILGELLIMAGLTCLAVAIMGDELFRVEVVLNRALVYALLTLLIIGVYVVVVGYLSLLFQAQGSVWLSLLATGLIAVLFQPLRERVQRVVNGLLYGRRDEPYQAIAGLGRRLEGAIEPAAVPAAIAETVRESLRLPYAAVVVPGVDGDEVIAASGAASGAPARLPLVYRGETVGHLLAGARRGDAGLSAADRALLAGLAQQAGPAVYSVRLLADLQRLSADLQASREQLVLAREEERRRLRRDLHDDLAPTLAGLSLRAGAIADLIAGDPARATALAEHLDAAIRDAVGNVRRLVYDLRPPALDDLGLLAAIRERALDFSGRGLSVTVDSPETLPPLPAAVEVAAYRIVQEGLMNVLKHAAASHCAIRLTAGDALAIEIADDGRGLADAWRGMVSRDSGKGKDAGYYPALQGIGLRSIRERAAELGGEYQIANGPEGTRLWVSLPLAGRPNGRAHE